MSKTILDEVLEIYESMENGATERSRIIKLSKDQAGRLVDHLNTDTSRFFRGEKLSLVFTIRNLGDFEFLGLRFEINEVS